MNSPMNALVDEFNRTVGQEQGIRVRVDSVSNSGIIHESVLAADYKDPGAPELPDLFVSAARDLQVGEVAPLVRSNAGFHIVKLIERENSAEARIAPRIASTATSPA